jgi:hypothetical protein
VGGQVDYFARREQAKRRQEGDAMAQMRSSELNSSLICDPLRFGAGRRQL